MKDNQKEIQNRAICGTCHQIVPVRHVYRDNNVYLRKECPQCGSSETKVSSDAKSYRQKREMLDYEGEAQKTCSMLCPDCNLHKTPTLVFIDVTNRCNMNCPICLANIPAMGFRFDPPMEYFEKIFTHLSTLDPKPKIELFGGEPTVREDLIEMIILAREKYGLAARVVTNGIKLVDEHYCQELLATGTELMFSYDGRSPKVYEKTRKHPGAYEKKTRALENISKHRKSKITIMTCVAEGINDEFMADLVEFCHEGRDYIAALDMIPLTVNWGPETVDAESASIEDVERIMKEAVPGMEFFPAGTLYKLQTFLSTFNVGRLTFGGAHPNCESVSVLVSDGTQYYPASKYLKESFFEVIKGLLKIDKKMGDVLKHNLLARIFGRKGRQIVYGILLAKYALPRINMRAVFGNHAFFRIVLILWGLLRGKKMKHLLRTHTKCHNILRVIVLPFEEKECVEAARLVDCPAAFAFEHPETREVRLMPVCAWAIYKNDILRNTAAHYGIDNKTGQEGLGALNRNNKEDQEKALASQKK